MGDEKSKRPIDPNISAYLRRPIRKLREAEQDKDASDSQWKPIPPPGSPGRGEEYSNPLEDVVPKASGQAQTEDGKERDRVLTGRAELIEKLKRSRLSTDMKKAPRKSEELD